MIWLATSVFMGHLYLYGELVGTERDMYSDPGYKMLLLVLEQKKDINRKKIFPNIAIVILLNERFSVYIVHLQDRKIMKV